MSSERLEIKDLYFPEGKSFRTCLSPRVFAIDKNGRFPLVRERTVWWGLPGGKINRDDIIIEKTNLSLREEFSTLSREFYEEVGFDISAFLEKPEATACLGMAIINIVDGKNERVTRVITPIFVCLVPNWADILPESELFTIEGLPRPLFPDVRLGLTRLKEGVLQNDGPVTPQWLNGKLQIYFEMRPRVGLLMGPPDWFLD